jgi:hypothetical protein
MDDPKQQYTYDPARALTYAVLFGVIMLTSFVCAMIGLQVYEGKTVSTEAWAALTFIMGWLTSEAGGIYSNRFGSTQQSATKDATIAAQAQTAAVVAATASPVAAAAVAAAAGQSPPVPAPAGTIQADTVNVTSLNADVTEVQPTEKDKP